MDQPLVLALGWVGAEITEHFRSRFGQHKVTQGRVEAKNMAVKKMVTHAWLYIVIPDMVEVPKSMEELLVVAYAVTLFDRFDDNKPGGRIRTVKCRPSFIRQDV